MIPSLADFTCIFLEIDPSSLIFNLMSSIGRYPSMSGSSISNLMVGCLLFRYSSMLSASFLLLVNVPVSSTYLT